MMPRSSAIGMKTAGDTAPRSVSVQRASVSKPRMRRLRRSTIGWKCGSTSLAGHGAAQRLLDAGDALAASSISRRVDDDAAASRTLGLVERGLGLVDQRRRVVLVAEKYSEQPTEAESRAVRSPTS